MGYGKICLTFSLEEDIFISDWPQMKLPMLQKEILYLWSVSSINNYEKMLWDKVPLFTNSHVEMWKAYEQLYPNSQPPIKYTCYSES
jgi:hypothetical protein